MLLLLGIEPSLTVRLFCVNFFFCLCVSLPYLNSNGRVCVEFELLALILFEFLLSRVDGLEKRIEEIERRVTTSTQRCNTMEEKYRATVQERERLHASLKESGKELDGLKVQLERLKRQLEDETVERVDLHNRIMSLNEEVAFIKKKHTAVRTVHTTLPSLWPFFQNRKGSRAQQTCYLPMFKFFFCTQWIS